MDTIAVSVTGRTPILFDRYSGSNEDQLPPEKKVYLSTEDSKTLVLPAINISSFLSSQNAESAPKRLLGKTWSKVAKAALSFVSIEPMEIPFLRNGKPLTIDNAGIKILRHVARVKKGSLVIPSPKERPALDVPWQLDFTLVLYPNPDLSVNTLQKLFVEGGIAIGFGTFRGVFGKFNVAKWDVS